MGTSLFERYQQEKAGPGESLYKQYLAQKQQPKPAISRESLRLDVRPPAESTRGLPYDPSRPGDMEAASPSEVVKGAAKVLPEAATGAVALAQNISAGIPGMRAAQAGIRSVVRDQPYREALGDLEEANKQYVPKEIETATKVVGTLPLAAVLPFSPAVSGAIVGGADQALTADPDVGVVERAGRSAVGAAAGAAVGKAFDVAGTGARALMAKPLGKNATARTEAMRSADDLAYGTAAVEGSAAGGTSPAIQNALAHPTVAPFTKAVRETQQFAQADDATVLAEAYKLMSETQRRLGRTVVNSADFRAGSSLQKAEIEIGKRELLKAADQVMPSFRRAVEQHAKAAKSIDAFNEGKRVAVNVVNQSTPPTADLAKRGPDAFRKRFEKMSPEEKKAAVEGILGRLRERTGIQPNAVSMGGLLTSTVRPARTASYLRQLGDVDQKTADAILRAALLSGASLTP